MASWKEGDETTLNGGGGRGLSLPTILRMERETDLRRDGMMSASSEIPRVPLGRARRGEHACTNKKHEIYATNKVHTFACSPLKKQRSGSV